MTAPRMRNNGDKGAWLPRVRVRLSEDLKSSLGGCTEFESQFNTTMKDWHIYVPEEEIAQALAVLEGD